MKVNPLMWHKGGSGCLVLTKAQADQLSHMFEKTATKSDHEWLRRSYAPMCIHSLPFACLRRKIETLYPDYTIAFDVIFENDGRAVSWHCDYDSLGPFEKPGFRALCNSNFISVHFNLTDDGGALRTYHHSILLSYLFYLTIVYAGFLGAVHMTLLRLCHSLFEKKAYTCSNRALEGNVFDNMRLHSISSGKPRCSYVVRLIKKGCVHISKASVRQGMVRSAPTKTFERLLHLLDSFDELKIDASMLDWSLM